MADQSVRKPEPFAPALTALKLEARESKPAEEQPGRDSPSGDKAAPAPEPRQKDKKDNELDALKAAVDDAASVSGGLWLSYVSAFVYLAVAAGAVTHKDLFFENPVKLPFFNVELPLVAFFFLAPILFVVVHAYTLVHFVMLAEKAKRFHRALHKRERNVTDADRENRQWQLPSNVFIQFLAGPPKLRLSVFGWLLRAIAWVTLAIAPVLLLLMMQIQFLPYHSSFVTWTERAALGADLLLIWWLWRRILSGREVDGGRRLAAWAWPPLGLALSLAVLCFSLAVVTFPGEWQEDRLLSWRFLPAMDEWGQPASEKDASSAPRTASFRDWAMNAERVSLHDWLFNAKPDPITRHRLPFSSTLVLPGLNVYEGLGIDDPEKAKWHDFVFRARARDLRGAIFYLASLPKVDFGGAHLEGALFRGSQLRGASLRRAQLQGASFEDAQLEGASLTEAQLQGASLDFAQLQGVSLTSAQLQGASLNGAQLQGASLDGVQLQGARLDRAQLQGASLHGAELQGASLYEAQLRGASFGGADLQGASFEHAILEAIDLSGAYLWRTNRPTPPSTVAAVRMSGETWLPLWEDFGQDRPWDDKAYQDLRTAIELLPSGDSRRDALERIRSLDCSHSDTTLASCNPSASPPPQAVAWRKALEAARVDEKVYALALTRVLKELVCSGGNDTIHVLRGFGFQAQLYYAGTPAFDLIDDLTNKDSKDCPVAASLTGADRANLLQIKQAIEAAKKPGI